MKRSTAINEVFFKTKLSIPEITYALLLFEELGMLPVPNEKLLGELVDICVWEEEDE